jgi:hypothetical protein
MVDMVDDKVAGVGRARAWVVAQVVLLRRVNHQGYPPIVVIHNIKSDTAPTKFGG